MLNRVAHIRKKTYFCAAVSAECIKTYHFKSKKQVDELLGNHTRAHQDSNRKSIKAIALHLSGSKSAGGAGARTVISRTEEEAILIDFLGEYAFWTENIDADTYIAEGAEQKVYFNETKNTVFKVNSGIFYASWADYFHSLLLHNFFFSDTAYTFLGMKMENNELFAVVEQPFIAENEGTNLARVKAFLAKLNFVNNRNNDYKNEALGIIIEDLHDENVLTKNGILYFIDTVFYITPNFHKNPFIDWDML